MQLRQTHVLFCFLLMLLLWAAPSLGQAQTIYSTNFSNFTPTNWQGWSADDGMWQVGAPTGGPKAAYDGDTQCAATGLGGNYATFQNSRFISPAITLPKLASGKSIELGFAQWFQFYSNGTPSYGEVEVSTGGATGPWTQVSRNLLGSNGLTNSNGWSNDAVDLSAYAGQKIWIAFHMNGGDTTAAGWFLDNVLVSVVSDWGINLPISFSNFTPTNWQGWSADDGGWQIGAPTGGPKAGFNGAAQAATTGLAGNYPTYMDSYLSSPAVTLPKLSAGQSVILGFWHWFQFYSRGTPSFGEVEVSTWNPTTASWSSWTQVSRNLLGSNALTNSNGWSYDGVDLSAYANQRIRVGFHMNAGDTTAAGWFLNNVELSVVSDWTYGSSVNFGNFNANSWQGWSTDDGVWQIGKPTAGPKAAYNGDLESATTSLAGSYPTYMDSYLISPPVTMPSVGSGQSLMLGFWHWFEFYSNGTPSYGRVEVSQWNPTTLSWGGWTQMSRNLLGSNALTNSNGWSYDGVDLSAYAKQRIRIGFHMISGDTTAAGWFLDTILLSTVPDWSFNQLGTFATASPSNWQGWFADDGVWQIGKPTAGPKAAYSGDTQSAFAQNYPVYMDSYLVSPPMTLPKLTTGQNLLLELWQWFDFLSNGTPSSGDVEISSWTSGAWSNWTQVSPTYDGSSSGWGFVGTTYSPINLSAYAGQRIRLGFHQNGEDTSGPGWFLDNVIVVAPPPTVKSFTPTSGLAATSSVPGTAVTLTGTLFTGATNVQFNGTSQPSFTVVSDSEITTTVPQGASGIGPISVTTPGGTGTSTSKFTVETSTVESVALSPATACPGMTATGTVTLAGAAPTGGVTVGLASGNAAALTVPATVTVAAGQTSGTFTATAGTVTAATAVIVTATGPSNDVTANVTVKPWLASASVSPTSITAGTNATFTVNLNAAAPAGGVAVTLASSSALAAFVNSSETAITSVTVPAGATSATVTVTSYATSSSQAVTLTASYQGVSSTATLTVTAGGATVTLYPTSVVGGSGSTGFVTLSAPAPAGGTIVTLSSSSTAASMPATVTVSAGEETAAFAISTTAVTATTAATITATLGTATGSAVLAIRPPAAIGTIVFFPNPVPGGNNAIGLLTLNGATSSSPITVTLSSSNTKVAMPDQTVIIAANSTTATFNVNTFTVSASTKVAITATINGHTFSGILTVSTP